MTLVFHVVIVQEQKINRCLLIVSIPGNLNYAGEFKYISFK
jgi:hypothetical protein